MSLEMNNDTSLSVYTHQNGAHWSTKDQVVALYEAVENC